MTEGNNIYTIIIAKIATSVASVPATVPYSINILFFSLESNSIVIIAWNGTTSVNSDISENATHYI